MFNLKSNLCWLVFNVLWGHGVLVLRCAILECPPQMDEKLSELWSTQAGIRTQSADADPLHYTHSMN